MNKQRKERRDRLVALSFVSLLLILVYGPAAPWFVAADRFIYDQLASRVSNKPLEDALIVSINPARKDNETILADYGDLIRELKQQNARRIVLANPPALGADGQLPGWAVTLATDAPVFVPSSHPFAGVATKNGIFTLAPDDDDTLRRSVMWHLQGGVMAPSLPLAIALHNPEFAADPRISSADVEMYLSNYAPLPRASADDVLRGNAGNVSGKTVFLDADPELVAASATLPSGQFVTSSEVAAALLADIEQGQALIAPAWVRALEWLMPALLAILMVLFAPERKRREILFLSLLVVTVLVLIELMMLVIGRVRLDLGRPILIFLGVSALVWWLAGTPGKSSATAFRRGSDFLAAGRLEPAFAEFRRCVPDESLATVMYKLSLAFEEQAKPERAEAVLDWLKKTQGPEVPAAATPDGTTRTPRRLGRYVGREEDWPRRNGCGVPGEGPAHQPGRGTQSHSY